MSWLQNHFGKNDDFDLYLKTLKDHNYFVWDIHYESAIKSVDEQILSLNQEVQSINQMSLASKAVMSPFQGLSNQLQSSNSVYDIAMAQHTNRIISTHYKGIQKNQRISDRKLKSLADVQERKRKLIEYDGELKRSKLEWEAQQKVKQAQEQALAASHDLNMNSQNDDNKDAMEQKVKDMQDKVKQMEDMMMNVQTHILSGNDGDQKIQIDDNAMEVWDWLTNVVELPQYFDVFMKNGFEDMESLEDLTMNELKNEIKITKLGHRKKLLKEIQKMKN